MKKLLLILNDVGNVGKSTLATMLESYCLSNSLRTRKLCTGDHDLTIEDEERGAGFVDLEDHEEAVTRLIGTLDTSDVVIADVHTGGLADLERLFEENNIHDLLGEIETEMTVVIPVGDHDDHMEHVVEIAESFADNNNYVVVHSGHEDEFDQLWNGSYAEKVMNYLDSTKVEIPAPSITTLFELASLGISVKEAFDAPESLPADLRRSLGEWEEASIDRIHEARELLFGDAMLKRKSKKHPAPKGIAVG